MTKRELTKAFEAAQSKAADARQEYENLAGEIECYIEEKTENREKWPESTKGQQWQAVLEFLQERTEELQEIEGAELPDLD